MFKNPVLRTLMALWLAWAVILLGFQAWAAARFDPKRPDYSLEWTPSETKTGALKDRLYLNEPFMNNQVAWDSEYYLSIAVAGYDDPLPPHIDVVGKPLSLNYAFMPFYPLMMRLLSFPLRILGLNPVATATLAGVLVSALGTLAAMLALYDLVREELGEAGGMRAAVYLLIFPSGFFLAQVYTEGLFVGLAFASLALIRRRQFLWAAVLAALAAWTRAVGVALVIPLAYQWMRSGAWMEIDVEWSQIFHRGLPWKAIGQALVGLLPLVAFAAWKFSPLGAAFEIVENNFFGRSILSFGSSYYTWSNAWAALSGDNPQMAAYYAVEFLAIFLTFIACLAVWRRYPEVAVFSLAVFILSLTSGQAQGMHRYVLGAPALFIFLSRLGKHPAFDRAWSLFSTLLMAVFAYLYTFDFWTG